MAAGHLAPRSVLHHPDRDGCIDVRPVVDRYARSAAESPGENDELHDAGDVYGDVPQLRIGSQSLLRGAEYCRASTAMDSAARTSAGMASAAKGLSGARKA